jgi:PP-loop superfamily ATP-utilizing enzyme
LNEKEKQMFLAWSHRPEFAVLVQDTLATIKQHVDAGKCMVAFSGGKDSTVLLHLALQVDPYIDVFLWDQGPHIMPREVHAEICGNAKTMGAKVF